MSGGARTTSGHVRARQSDLNALPGDGRSRARARPPARPTTRTRLSLVRAPAGQRHGGAFVALLVAVLAGGLVGLLVLNTAMQQSAFELDRLRDQETALGVRRQVLELKVDRLRSPDHLARAATELGMVQLTGPVFLRLDDGKVLGSPAPAVAGTGPELVPVREAPKVADPPREQADVGEGGAR